jgi:putative nucleotidyltransferase with HDIG domain
MKLRILFVDDEPNVLEAVRRMLHSMRHEWTLGFAENGIEALALLEQEEFDVVVSDVRMPLMDGIQLLTEVKARFPQAIRIVLSGQSKREQILRSVGLAHQYLSKPSSCEELKDTIARVSNLRDVVSDPALQALVAKIGNLPSLPSIHAELIAELQAEECSVHGVGEIVSRDVGLTAKLLQLVNSSFFGLPVRVSTASQAVHYLGIDTIRALILSHQAMSAYENKVPTDFSLSNLWRRSLETAFFARHIASCNSNDSHVISDAWTAGLLHDVGKMILASAMPDQNKIAAHLAQIHSQPIWIAERSVFGTSHAEVGACLLGLWGLPEGIVEAVAYHHRPDDCVHQEFGALAAVYAGSILESGDVDLIASTIEGDPFVLRLGLADTMRKLSGSKPEFLIQQTQPAA